MLNFKQFLAERAPDADAEAKEKKILANIEKHSLGIPRRDMPQISADMVQEFLDWLETDHNISSKKDKLTVSRMKATQNQLNFEKVHGMIGAKTADALAKPMIVSRDGYLVDGHHRFAALYIKEPTKQVPIFRIDTDIKTLLKLSKKFHGTKYKNINETRSSFLAAMKAIGYHKDSEVLDDSELVEMAMKRKEKGFYQSTENGHMFNVFQYGDRHYYTTGTNRAESRKNSDWGFSFIDKNGEAKQSRGFNTKQSAEDAARKRINQHFDVR